MSSKPLPVITPLDEQPATPEQFYDDWLFIKQIPLEAGQVVPQHSHEYDHVTALLSGEIDVWIDGEYAGERSAPTLIPIPAGTKHLFQAKAEGCVLYCVHNLRGEGYPAVRDEHHLTEG